MTEALRSLLRHLEATAPSEIQPVKRAVSIDFELTGVLRRLQADSRIRW